MDYDKCLVISDECTGIDIKNTCIIIDLKFPQEELPIKLHRARDIIGSYKVMKNNYTICDVPHARNESELVSFLTFSNEKPLIIDQEYVTLKIKLTDLLCFFTMESNLPSSHEKVKLFLKLNHKFPFIDSDNNWVTRRVPYIIRNIELEKRYALDDTLCYDIGYKQYEEKYMISMDGDFRIKLNFRDLEEVYMLVPFDSYEIEILNAELVQVTENLLRVVPDKPNSLVKINMSLEGPYLYLINIREKVLFID